MPLIRRLLIRHARLHVITYIHKLYFYYERPHSASTYNHNRSHNRNLLASVKMQNRQELSVVFKDDDEKECEKYPVPNGNTDNKIAAQALVSMEHSEKIGITLMTEPKFIFRNADGLRVIIAMGNGPPSPDNDQGFWISRSKQDQRTTWTHFFAWASERAKRHQRRLKAPAPQGKIYASAAPRYSANILLRWRFPARTVLTHKSAHTLSYLNAHVSSHVHQNIHFSPLRHFLTPQGPLVVSLLLLSGMVLK